MKPPCPALYFALAFAAGIGLGEWKGGNVMLLVLLCGILCILILIFRFRSWISPWILAFLIGTFYQQVESSGRLLPQPLNEAAPKALWIEAEGYFHLPSAPSRSQNQNLTWYFTIANLSAPQLHLAYQGSRTFKVTFANAVEPSEFQNYTPGRIQGYLRKPLPLLNPHQIPVNLKFQGLAGWIEVIQWESTAIVQKPFRELLRETGAECSDWVKKKLTESIQDRYPRESSLILAMVLGVYPQDDPSIQEAFAHSGTLHLFSVSGLHVAIIAVICIRLFKVLPLPKSFSPLLTILVCFFYAFLTGWSAASVRAAVMISVILTGKLLNRRGTLLNNLGVAALLILLSDPYQLFQIGFQLSFSVMLGIGLFEPLLGKWGQRLASPDPFIPKTFLSPSSRTLWKLQSNTLSMALSSGSALISSTPLTLFYFNLITPISILANFILIPISFIILWLSSLSLVFHSLTLSKLANTLNLGNALVAKGCYASAEYFSKFPGGHRYLSASEPESSLRILALPKGEFAIHFQVSPQNHILLDTGSDSSFPFVLRPYLRGQGVMRLDGLITSHKDRGHTGAVQWIQNILPIQPPSSRTSAHPFGEVTEYSYGESASKQERYTPHFICRNQDDACSVFRWEWKGYQFLYTSDAGFLTEKAMLATFSPSDLKCDVLIRSNHRSDLSASADFLKVVAPKFLITSSPDFPENEKLPDHLPKTCEELDIKLLNLHEEGSLIFQKRGVLLEIHGFFSGKKWQLPR